MSPEDIAFADLAPGAQASFTGAFSDADVAAFAALSGDHNPLHTDATYAATTPFKKPIVHGMLVGSLCSTLVGMHLPGKQCLYLSQSLTFKKPVYAGDALTVTGTVVAKSEATRVLEIAIVITREAETVVEGVAQVQVRPA